MGGHIERWRRENGGHDAPRGHAHAGAPLGFTGGLGGSLPGANRELAHHQRVRRHLRATGLKAREMKPVISWSNGSVGTCEAHPAALRQEAHPARAPLMFNGHKVRMRCVRPDTPSSPAGAAARAPVMQRAWLLTATAYAQASYDGHRGHDNIPAWQVRRRACVCACTQTSR